MNEVKICVECLEQKDIYIGFNIGWCRECVEKIIR